jgi:riboflavin kinase/FMN adenylyltransferase
MKHKLPVALSGTTKPYNGNGRDLGYPTANLAVKTSLADGVYFGFADLAKYNNHPALIFVGVPSTLGNRDRRVEAHLLDIPDKDYYGQKLHLQVCVFHRANQRFSSLDALKKAMRRDEEVGRGWFSK